jgi:hypothetical protein
VKTHLQLNINNNNNNNNNLYISEISTSEEKKLDVKEEPCKKKKTEIILDLLKRVTQHISAI